MEETKGGGPFKEIVEDHDIFVNCIFLKDKVESPSLPLFLLICALP